MKNEEIKIQVEGEFTAEQIWTAFKVLFNEKEIADFWKQSYDNYLKEKEKNEKSI